MAQPDVPGAAREPDANTTRLEATVQGQIEASAGSDLSDLSVRLQGFDAGGFPLTAAVEPNGRFTIEHVPMGPYTLQLLDREGGEIKWESVTVISSSQQVTLRLEERRQDVPTGEVVSAARLMRRPSKQALRDAAKAARFSAASQYRQAAGMLERAIAEDPEYPEAYNNLGVQYARLGRVDDAIRVFRRSAELDPAAFQARVNLAVILAQTGRLPEAEQWALSALRIDGTNHKAAKLLAAIRAARPPKK
jgi:tetratricopeptide (TPR) repeat protein